MWNLLTKKTRNNKMTEIKCTRCNKVKDEKYTAFDYDRLMGFFCQRCSEKIADKFGFHSLAHATQILHDKMRRHSELREVMLPKLMSHMKKYLERYHVNTI